MHFSNIFCIFTYKVHKKYYHNVLGNKYYSTFYTGKRKGAVKINDAAYVKSARYLLKYFLSRQCSFTHRHEIPWKKH